MPHRALAAFLLVLSLVGCTADVSYPPLEVSIYPEEDPMAARYSSPVATRVAGAVVSSSDQNDVDNRVVQLSQDLGGEPADLNTDNNSSFRDAINENSERAGLPRVVSGQGFCAKGSDIGDMVYTNTGVYRGASGGTMELWAPIQLPHGKALGSLKVHANLASTSAQVEVSLRALDKASVSSSALATVTLTGSSGAIHSDTSVSSHTVDNDTYAYFFHATLTNDGANQATLVAAEVR